MRSRCVGIVTWRDLLRYCSPKLSTYSVSIWLAATIGRERLERGNEMRGVLAKAEVPTSTLRHLYVHVRLQLQPKLTYTW